MGEYDELLKELRQQEEDIQFASFSNDTALVVGMALVKAARERGKAVTIDITRAGQQLFHFAMAGTSIDNGEWVWLARLRFRACHRRRITSWL